MATKAKPKYPRRKIHPTNPFKSVFSVRDIMAQEPCYDPVERGVLPKGWRGTLDDFLAIPNERFPKRHAMVDDGERAEGAASDKMWVVLEMTQAMSHSRYLDLHRVVFAGVVRTITQKDYPSVVKKARAFFEDTPAASE